MNRITAAIALILLATPAAGLERSPNDRGTIGGGGHQSASSERGERVSGDRGGRDVGSTTSYSRRDHSGRDHN